MLVYGDSLSSAYGMPERRGWVALLEERMKRERPHYSVANAIRSHIAEVRNLL